MQWLTGFGMRTLAMVSGCVLLAGLVRGENELIVLDQFVDYANGRLNNQAGQGFGWAGDWGGKTKSL